MSQIELRSLYSGVHHHLQVGKVCLDILGRVVAADDKGTDFEETIKTDQFFTEKILKKASEALKKGEVKSISHAVVLIGKDTTRNFVLGHTLSRCLDTMADQKFTDLGEAAKLLKRSVEAEELANKASCPYSGMAFAAGYIFDLLEQWINSDPKLQNQFSNLLGTVFKHGLRTASLAWALSTHERILVHHKRLSFGAGLLHDVGRIFLACRYPDGYEKLLPNLEELKTQNISDDRYQAEFELENLGLSHAEVGSLLMSHFGFLSELEEIIDFHHDFAVLKTRSSDTFILATVLNIADRLAYYLDNTSQPEESEVKKILEVHKAVFPLQSHEVLNMIAALRSKGILA